jgi:hypothetical protein
LINIARRPELEARLRPPRESRPIDVCRRKAGHLEAGLRQAQPERSVTLSLEYNFPFALSLSKGLRLKMTHCLPASVLAGADP